MTFNQDKRRNLQNLRQFYETWKEVNSELARLPGGLYWKVSNNKEYLYRYVTEAGMKRTTSVGPRTPKTEAEKALFDETKKNLQERKKGIEERIRTLAPVMRALRFPAIDDMAGKILRALDQTGEIGSQVMVIGTYAITAYEMAAETNFAEGFDATEDLDLTIVTRDDHEPDPAFPRRFLLTLKELDRTFIVSISSPKTVVNKSGYRVDLLMSVQAQASMAKASPWRPEALEGQEWLLLGSPVQQLLIDYTGWPVLAVAPDPRYFAVHKLWLSRRPKRIRDGKAPKDATQGRALLAAIRDFMPLYPLDEGFIASLPKQLRDVWEPL